MRALLRPRCLILPAIFVTVGVLPITYSLLESFLLRYGEGRLVIGIHYPTPGTRIVGVLSAAAAAAGVCLLWGGASRTSRSKVIAAVGLAVGSVVVMGAVGLIVRSMTLEYYPNEAAVRWFVPVGAVLLIVGAVTAVIRNQRAS